MNDDLKLLDNYVKERTDKAPVFPEIVSKAVDTISGDVPFNLKLIIVLSELMTFSGHLRKPLKLYDGTVVPVNAISFALSGSGTSKDKALNAIRKSLSSAYIKLEEARREYAKSKAKKKAKLEGVPDDQWEKFYVSPKPLQAGLGTPEGLLHHFADIQSDSLGSGSLLSNEIGSDIQANGSMLDIVKNISIAYDLGNIPAKIIKGDNQTPTITGLPVNALFFGSHEAILFDNSVKAKFKLMFNTQLARRSLFSFTPETPVRTPIGEIDNLYLRKSKERKRVLEAQEIVDTMTSTLVDTTNHEPLVFTPYAEKLFDVYLEYNAIRSEQGSRKYPIAALSRKHKQWLALKVAGAYSILLGEDEVTEETYATAINTVEHLAADLVKFEKELIKEPYEQLVSYCKNEAQEGKFSISLHELRKLGYITGTGSAKAKLQDLIDLVTSYDTEATYTLCDTGICYAETVKAEVMGLSYIIF